MSTKPPPTKRPSQATTTTTTTSLPAAIFPPCTIHPTALVADKAQITGSHPVSISEKAVIHPYARIRAENAPVTIGAYCVVAESAIVGGGAEEVVLERWVSVESGAVVEARRVGEGTEIGVQAKVGGGAVLGAWCRVTPLEVVREGEQVAGFTVVFGDGQRRRDRTLAESAQVRKMRVKGVEGHVEVLGRLVVDGKGKWVG